MHIISKRRLTEAARTSPDALPSLMHGYRVAREARWGDLHETRVDFPHADPVGKFTVSNIKKDAYRLITVIHDNRSKVDIRAVLAHGDSDKGHWKDD